MIRLKALLIAFFIFYPCLLFAQHSAAGYARADSLARTVKYEDDINLLTQKLTTPFSDPFLKARAIFRWITLNIDYDYKYYNSHQFKGREPKGFECEGDSMDCSVKLKVWETRYVLDVLRKRKAVCEGYARLFKTMCGIAGIEAQVVPGYVRTEFYEVGTTGDLDHAWNVVLLNGAYYLVDATWAAGTCEKDDEGKLKWFYRYFNEYYWLTPADLFARNHFPEDPKWVLLPHYTKDNFSANPYYWSSIIPYLRVISPQSGIITAKKGDTLHFKIKYSDSFHDLQINTNIFTNPDIWTYEYQGRRMLPIVRLDTIAVKKQQYVSYKRSGDEYEFAYVVKDYSLDYIDVLFDRQRVLRFKVRVHG